MANRQHILTRWLDVGTTAIPRLLTARCMESFLDKMIDRDKYLLRWIFHLDWIDHLAFRGNWRTNLVQAVSFSRHFDDALILASTTNQGYDGSILNALRHVRGDVLWVEDDKIWTKPFRVESVIENSGDGFFFLGPDTRCGSTSPSFWRHRLAVFLRDWLIQCPNLRTIRERDLIQVAGHYESNRTMGDVPSRAFGDLGWQFMADAGFSRNLFGHRMGRVRKTSVLQQESF